MKIISVLDSTLPRLLWTAYMAGVKRGGGRGRRSERWGRVKTSVIYELQRAESRKIPIIYNIKSNQQVNSDSTKEQTETSVIFKESINNRLSQY